MELLLEDATYLAGGLALVGVAFLVALRVTQQGRYLLWALAALGLAAAALVIEHFWVTDTERIEQVVYALRDAVAASDAEGVLSHLTPDVEFVQHGSTTYSDEATRAYIRSILTHAKFDFVRISHLKTEASRLSRLGSAEFRVIAGGSINMYSITHNFATTNSDWSLGFQETSPGVWKVNRITPTRIPNTMPTPETTEGSGSSSGPRPSPNPHPHPGGGRRHWPHMPRY